MLSGIGENKLQPLHMHTTVPDPMPQFLVLTFCCMDIIPIFPLILHSGRDSRYVRSSYSQVYKEITKLQEGRGSEHL